MIGTFIPTALYRMASTGEDGKYRINKDGKYRINKAIRDLCVFAKQNVAGDPPFSRVDLISCRNLLILSFAISYVDAGK
jgi:two-component system, chemotaxis family, CheB/CheR fusion protein